VGVKLVLIFLVDLEQDTLEWSKSGNRKHF